MWQLLCPVVGHWHEVCVVCAQAGGHVGIDEVVRHTDKPDDVANAAVFYLSPASRWITGTTLVMDGGLTIN